MSQTRSMTVDDEAAEYVAQWSSLDHPFEAAVLDEVNEPSGAVHRAAEILHRCPPGVEGPTRSVWVVARCHPRTGGGRQELVSWCWYATRAAAESVAKASPGATVLHETVVPRTVRCDDVAAYLARRYHVPAADPAA